MKPEYIALGLFFIILISFFILYGVQLVDALRIMRWERAERRYERQMEKANRKKQKEKLWQIPFRRRWRK